MQGYYVQTLLWRCGIWSTQTSFMDLEGCACVAPSRVESLHDILPDAWRSLDTSEDGRVSYSEWLSWAAQTGSAGKPDAGWWK